MNILGIYAHPDDESMLTGGLLAFYGKKHKVTVYCATCGEKGSSCVKHLTTLATMRLNELKRACNVLHVKLVTDTFPDGFIEPNKVLVTHKVKEIIKQYKPDQIITIHTFNGHPDHKAIGDIVLKVAKVPVLIRTFTKARAEELTKYLGYKIYPQKVDCRFNVAGVISEKIEGILSHESQSIEGKVWAEISKLYPSETYERR